MRNGMLSPLTRIALVGLILVSAAARVQAATVTVGPSNCSAAAVNTAIGTANDGDTVLLTCTGSISWAQTGTAPWGSPYAVFIPATKGITLQVQGGTNTPKTSANFPLIITPASGVGAILVTIAAGNTPVRITGFKFGPNSGTVDGLVAFSGAGNGSANIGAYRLDNNYFDTISCTENVAAWAGRSGATGNLWGLIDNNTFHNVWRQSDTTYGCYNIQIWNYFHPAGSNQCWGCTGWSNNDFSYGSSNFTFVENNLFEQTAGAPGHMRHYISSELGARYVSRFNTFSNNFPDTNADLHDAHGLCLVSSNGAGSRGGEIYDNTITGTGYDRGMQLRGGSWMIFSNVITAGGGNPIEFNEYRAETSSSCDATNNLAPIEPSWPVPTNGPSLPTWNTNAAWVPYAPANGNGYQLPQQVHNSYAWLNTAPGGAVINPAVPTGTEEQTYVQPNRDYWPYQTTGCSGTQTTGVCSGTRASRAANCTKGVAYWSTDQGSWNNSGTGGQGVLDFCSATNTWTNAYYTPYSYPHPLQGAGGGGPAPTGLKASVK